MKPVVWTLLALAALAAFAPRLHAQEDEPERVFVLVVGVEDYEDPKITDLRYAEHDASAVAAFFSKDPASPTSAERVLLLRGRAATRVGVLRAMRDHLIRQATGPRDVAILYFAGHGFSDAYGVYLATVDTRLDDLQYTSVAQAELAREWAKVSAGRRLFLVDACRSGGLPGLRGYEGVGKKVLAVEPGARRGSAVLAATGPNQLSVEDAKAGHGVFTLSLLEGLRGKADADRDHRVSLAELSAHLGRDVPRRARSAGGNQTPSLRLEGDEGLIRGLTLGRPGSLEAQAKVARESKRLLAERRAAKAEAEAAELRRNLAALQGKLKEAQEAAQQAAAARQRLAELEREAAAGSDPELPAHLRAPPAPQVGARYVFRGLHGIAGSEKPTWDHDELEVLEVKDSRVRYRRIEVRGERRKAQPPQWWPTLEFGGKHEGARVLDLAKVRWRTQRYERSGLQGRERRFIPYVQGKKVFPPSVRWELSRSGLSSVMELQEIFPPGHTGYDLSYVEAGQKYDFELGTSGGKRRYEVLEKKLGRVRYAVSTWVRGISAGPPTERWWPCAPDEPAPQTLLADEPEPKHESLRLAGRTWVCMVLEGPMGKTWVALSRGLPAWPGVVQTERKGLPSLRLQAAH